MTARVVWCWVLAAGVLCLAAAAVGTVLCPLLMGVGVAWFLLGCTEWQGGRA